jgi:deoxycytidylate deaminase
MSAVRSIIKPELVIGLVGAVGSNLSDVISVLTQELKIVGYNTYTIKLSDLIRNIAPHLKIKCPLKGAHNELRIEGLMDAGNELRRLSERSDALAILAINAIIEYRKKHNKNLRKDKGKTPVSSQAYILDSLKHPEEVKKLREIYGDNFLLISLYAPQEKREERLYEKIKSSHSKYRDSDTYKVSAKHLVEKDAQQEGISYGQNVRETFPLADFFLKEESDDTSLGGQIRRFIKLLFYYPYSTPTVDEYCMFAASAAALRSADLSRQVGAVIASEEGEILSSGCNEVPKAGGGAFWEHKDNPDTDYRDFKKESDANAMCKMENIVEIFQILKKQKLLSAKASKSSPEQLAEMSLLDPVNPFLKSSGIANAIEYGRIVHAEMTAVTEAARRGIPVKNTILYCTTFPCHMCARHILACGINKVIYIEPYPKSLTKNLYGRSVKIDDGVEADNEAVLFEPFVGIAPRLYMPFFQMPKRKDKAGHTINWKPEEGLPRTRNSTDARYIFSEIKENAKFTQELDKIIYSMTGG